MSKIYGRAMVAGIAGTVTHAALGANSAAVPQSVEATHQWNESEVLRDPSSGKPLGFLITDEARDVTIDFIPASDGLVANTKAEAAGALPFPAPYAIVTLASFTNTELNDTYLYIGGGSQSYTPGGAVRWRLPIKRYKECDDAELAALATEVS